MIKWPEIQYAEVEDGMLDPVLEFPKQRRIISVSTAVCAGNTLRNTGRQAML